MKENMVGFIILGIFIFAVYTIATLFAGTPEARQIPDDMVGNCTAYGDCF